MKEQININGKNITIYNDKIYIDGLEYVPANNNIDTVEFRGNAKSITSDCSFIIYGNVEGDIDVGASLSINGDVKGNIDVGGSVSIKGNHTGTIDAGGHVVIQN